MKQWSGIYRVSIRALDDMKRRVVDNVIEWVDYELLSMIKIVTDDNLTVYYNNYTIEKVEKIYYTINSIEYVEVDI
jgi:hypothetical protein